MVRLEIQSLVIGRDGVCLSHARKQNPYDVHSYAYPSRSLHTPYPAFSHPRRGLYNFLSSYTRYRAVGSAS